MEEERMASAEDYPEINSGKLQEKASSCSWRKGTTQSYPSSQSQWLNNTLSEVEKKTNMLLNILQENGETFGQRAEMYYRRRPELMKMIEELYKSYRSLAEKYDQLIRAQSTLDPDRDVRESKTDPEEEASDGSVKSSSNCREREREREKTWNGLRAKVSELIEDNLQQQGELIRRNEEKRKTIKDLCSTIHRLADENRSLKTRLALSPKSHDQVREERSPLAPKRMGVGGCF